MKRLILTAPQERWQELRQSLLQEDGKERQAFLELGLREDADTLELLLHRSLVLADADYVSQGRFQVQPRPQAVINAYNSFLQANVLVHGHIHSHPFAAAAVGFSGVDQHSLQEMRRGLADLLAGGEILREAFCFQMVIGQEPHSFQGILLNLRGEVLGHLAEVRLISPSGWQTIGQEEAAPAAGLGSLDERWDRNIRWLGEAGQQQLRQTHVALCGLGGLGALLVANLRGLGLGEITLVDPERLEMSNLNRFVGAGIEDVGSYKVDICRREIRRVAPETVVHAFAAGVEDVGVQEHLRQADFIVAAVDGMQPRAALQVLAARFLRPLFDLGSGILVEPDGRIRRQGSQIVVYLPGGPCLACQGLDLFRPTEGIAGEIRRQTGYVVGRPEEATPTAVTTINAVAAGWAVDLIIKFLTGLAPIPLYTQINQWQGTVSQYRYQKKITCPICGATNIEGKGEDRGALPPSREPTAGWLLETQDHAAANQETAAGPLTTVLEACGCPLTIFWPPVCLPAERLDGDNQ